MNSRIPEFQKQVDWGIWLVWMILWSRDQSWSTFKTEMMYHSHKCLKFQKVGVGYTQYHNGVKKTLQQLCSVWLLQSFFLHAVYGCFVLTSDCWPKGDDDGSNQNSVELCQPVLKLKYITKEFIIWIFSQPSYFCYKVYLIALRFWRDLECVETLTFCKIKLYIGLLASPMLSHG